ncbi:MAG: PaaI family thioesterase [Candidatus Alcyoniella australis]|nr:PaaI family thioesterase [Candidatus Alcyoniella australis]
MENTARSIELPRSRDCFLCGFENPHGLDVCMRIVDPGGADEHARAEFTPAKRHQGYVGVMHGGIAATLLDEVMGWAPAYRRRRICMAVELKLRYLKPVPVDTPLCIIGRVEDDSRRIWSVKGEINGPEGTTYVKAEGKYFPLSPEDSAKADQIELIYAPGCAKLFSE